jgi:protein TonB
MTSKKNKKADLERKRKLFFQIGMVITLGIILLAFEWKSEPTENKFERSSNPTDESEIEMPVTFTEKEKKLPPPPPVPPEEFQKVPDNFDIDDKDAYNIEDVGIDPDDGINYEDIVRKTEEKTEDVHVYVEEQPTFRGEEMIKYVHYVQKNIEYPEIAIENKIEGKVYVKFTIEKDGSISEIAFPREIDPVLSKEVKRVLLNSPKFSPGKINGKPVRYRCSIPVNFKLKN